VARITVRVFVSGRVQGVSFRAIMMEMAVRHRVDGWVRNRADGSVEALLQGEQESVEALVEWARIGPPRASVSSVTEQKLTGHPHEAGFRILE